MKLHQVLKETGMDDSWEQQKVMLKRIGAYGSFIDKNTEYKEAQHGVLQSSVDVVTVIFPARYKDEVMVQELSKPENFLDMIEFAYIKGEMRV